MYQTPEGYKQAINGEVAKVDIYIAIGSNIDPTASDDITAIEGQYLPMSNTEQVTDANYQITDVLATFEGDGIKTAPDAGNIAPPLVSRAYPPQVGIWSAAISDAQGNIDFSIMLKFSKPHTSALSLYTHDMSILEGTATFYNGGAEVRTSPFKPGSGRAMVDEPATYDAIRLHVSKVDKPYIHVKIAEVEFGMSVTYSKTRLVGNVSLVQEWDPLMLSIPLYELDFSIINVMGDYDQDNPNGFYDSIKQDYPVELSFSIEGQDGHKYTVPCGRFMIASRRATDTTLDIVALDARSALSNNHGGLSLDHTQSFGDMFKVLFKNLNIPFTVDEVLFSEYPDQDMTFDGEKYDLLMIMRFIEQYYNIWLVPERIGSIRATKAVPMDDYGEIPTDMVIRYPKSDVGKTFNYISIAYGPMNGRQNHVEDLRTDPAQLRSQIAINNPLIQTETKARELADKIRAALYTEKVTTEWRGDPSLDVTDTLRVAGKWTQGDPGSYRGIYLELIYDGGMSERTTTYH